MLRLILSALVVALLVVCVAAAADEPQPAAGQEKTDFDTVLDRLKNNGGAAPHAVDDAVDSLSMTVTKTIDCPGTAQLDSVEISITTQQIAFDPNLTIDGKAVPLPRPRAGYYVWRTHSEAADGKKTVTATNYVMLDPKVMNARETNPLGMLANEGLLYHELLHGQLLIDAMDGNADWRLAVCNCTFDLAPSENDTHATIPTEVEGYLTDRAGEDVRVGVGDVAPETAAEDGCFAVPVADVADFPDKEQVDLVSWYSDRDPNIDPSSLMLETKDGELVLTGCLVDKEKRGFVFVLLDPPFDVLFVGVEEAVVVEPLVADIPALGWAGLALLASVLLLVAVLVLVRARRGRA